MLTFWVCSLIISSLREEVGVAAGTHLHIYKKGDPTILKATEESLYS